MSGAVTPRRVEGGAEDCTDCTLALDIALELEFSRSNRGVALRIMCGAWAAGALAYGVTWVERVPLFVHLASIFAEFLIAGVLALGLESLDVL